MAEKSSPGTRQTEGKNLVWFGEIKRKLAKLSMPTFAYRSSSSLFYDATGGIFLVPCIMFQLNHTVSALHSMYCTCTYTGHIGTGMCLQGRMKRKNYSIESWFQYAPCWYRCGGGMGVYSTWTRAWILTFGACTSLKPCNQFFWRLKTNDSQKLNDSLICTILGPPLLSLYNTFKGTQEWEFFLAPILNFVLFHC